MSWKYNDEEQLETGELGTSFFLKAKISLVCHGLEAILPWQ